MYKIICLLFLPLFIASCGGSSSTADTVKSDSLVVDSNILMIGNVKFEISPLSKEEFEKYPTINIKQDTGESKNISSDSMRIKRSGDSLILVAERGRCILKNINDTMDELSNVSYHFIRNDEKHKMWIVDAGYYEWANTILVDQITGDSTIVCGAYAFSPDQQYLFTVSNSMADEGYAQLFEKRNGKYHAFQWVEAPWVVEEIKWISSNQILIKKHIPSFGEGDREGTIEYIKLTMK